MSDPPALTPRPFLWHKDDFVPGPDLKDTSVDLEARVRLHQICTLCHEFGQWLFTLLEHDERRVYEHHKSGHDLARSVKLGCHLCTLILSRLSYNGVADDSAVESLGKLLLVVTNASTYIPPNDTYQFSFGIESGSMKAYLKIFAHADNGRGIINGQECHVLQPTATLATSDEDTDWTSETHLRELMADITTSVYTASPAFLKAARLWMERCLSTHEVCRRAAGQGSFAPTRLVQIQRNSASGEVVLQLVEPGSGGVEKTPLYMALSYCWGAGSDAHALRAHNKSSLQAGFGLGVLPKTIAQAIEVAERLGAGYIWVDSLCIQQDDNEDWKREASRMRDVYKHSLLVIGALAASSSHQGLYAHRDPLSYCPCRLVGKEVLSREPSREPSRQPDRLPRRNRRTVRYAEPLVRQPKDQTSSLYVGILDESSSRWGPPGKENWFESAPLHTRAWVIQERFLAPRTLNFGLTVVWECLEAFSEEFDWKRDPRNGMSEGSVTTKRKAALLEDTRYLLDTWDHILSHYSRAKLSHATDRPVAIQGFIDQFQRVTGWANIHGLWEPFLLRELLWRIADSAEEVMPRIKGTSTMAMPSWSWISIESHVESGWLSPEGLPVASITKSQSLNDDGNTMLAIDGAVFDVIPDETHPGYSHNILIKLRGMGEDDESTFIRMDTDPILPGPYQFIPFYVNESSFFDRQVHIQGLVLAASPTHPGKYERVAQCSLGIQSKLADIEKLCKATRRIYLV